MPSTRLVLGQARGVDHQKVDPEHEPAHGELLLKTCSPFLKWAGGISVWLEFYMRVVIACRVIQAELDEMREGNPDIEVIYLDQAQAPGLPSSILPVSGSMISITLHDHFER